MEIQPIQNKIYEIRGVKVMLDFDLAQLYQVETKALKQAVRRNFARFEGEDFMFEISEQEYNSLTLSLRSQIVTSSSGMRIDIPGEHGGRRYMPFAFTETGVAMLSSVLRSETAIMVNRSIMRAFVAIRNHLASSATISAELAEIRAKVKLLENESESTNEKIDSIYKAISTLSARVFDPPKRPRNKIGYYTQAMELQEREEELAREREEKLAREREQDESK
jgi:hypothetical protein